MPNPNLTHADVQLLDALAFQLLAEGKDRAADAIYAALETDGLCIGLLLGGDVF